MVILALGTNLGDRLSNIHQALKELCCYGKISSISNIYESEPWGYESENRFFNMVISYQTELSPVELLKYIKDIEINLGRKTKSCLGVYADRPIDIDIIDFDGEILSSESLTLPHPLMHKRNFVLLPLCDILPEWKHPIFSQTAYELLNKSDDTSNLYVAINAKDVIL